jgi:formyl-CoA transferase
MTLFAGIMLALYQRQLTGRGTKVQTSLMANGVWSNACNVQAALCGAAFAPKWTRKTAINPMINHYLVRDGHRIFFCLLDAPRDWPNLCRALGFEDLIDDERFSTSAARRCNTAELVARMDAVFAQHDLEYWRCVLKQHDLNWGPVPAPWEVAEDAQLEEAGMLAEIHPGLKTVQNPIQVEGIEKIPPRLAPEVGAHTREVLRSIHLSDDEINSMIDRGAAFGKEPA